MFNMFRYGVFGLRFIYRLYFLVFGFSGSVMIFGFRFMKYTNRSVIYEFGFCLELVILVVGLV